MFSSTKARLILILLLPLVLFPSLALAESPRMALALSAGLCLVLFSMTFGLERRLQPQKEEAAA